MEINIFSLHGKWYENNENRLTSNLLFFLDKFNDHILKLFCDNFLPELRYNKKDINEYSIDFQVYDFGKIPDAEIILGNDKRILVESKIHSNLIKKNQVKEYCLRLKQSQVNYPDYYLLVITQTDQKQRIARISRELEFDNIIESDKIIHVQWKEIMNFFKDIKDNTNNYFLIGLLNMFLEEVENTLYNRIDIKSMELNKLNEVVLTTQNKKFYKMALEDQVFWPTSNFKPSQFVAYYFTSKCPVYSMTISHLAQIKNIWHNVTIDEVLTSIPEFQNLPDFKRFKERALEVYDLGNEKQFAIAITEKPIKLNEPIKYEYNKEYKLNPNILPGRRTTLSKLLQADIVEDLY